MEWKYAKIEIECCQDDKYVSQLTEMGWELFSVRAYEDGEIYAIFRTKPTENK